ncbi:ribosome maturation protein [Aspergillus pseudoustus]|uniref:Ribosome maturation protein n=1 Tax=Aspergillus pseudoustus TaxID=1810923 RepID=A0ABR4JZZ7_9EURO
MRANDPSNKIFYKGKSDDFIVFVEDAATLNNWRNDSSVPLSDVINGWKIFVTHKHGSQGVLDGASKASLENEFGTANDEECVKKILEGGELQGYTQRERGGDTNIRNGPQVMLP